jgi:predicted DCC family thiol-disulfide oxidoreductase YuxK
MYESNVASERLNDKDTAKLTLFFDGCCPLCSAEMQQLKKLDHLNSLKLVDLHQTDFDRLFPHVDKEQANQILQAQLADGTMLYGLDANCTAWKLVGKKRWLKILRWPVVRRLADIGYLVFAKNRSTISLLLTGQRRCASCAVKN